MEEVKDDKSISIGSSPQEFELLNKEIPITSVIYEANKQKSTESENSTIPVVQDINAGLSSDPSVLQENPNATDNERITSVQLNASSEIVNDAPLLLSSDRNIEESSPTKAVESTTSDEQSISLKDSNKTSSVVEGIVKDSSQPLSSDEFEEGSSRKAVESAHSNEHLMSNSPDDSNKIDSSVEGILKDASQPLPSNELDHSQIEDKEEGASRKVVESPNSNEYFMSISPDDSSNTGSSVEGIAKNASQPLPSDEFDHSQIEVGASKKSVESSCSDEQLISISPNDSNKTGSRVDVESIVKDASQLLPSDEFDHNQIEGSSTKKAVESATSNEQLMSISPEDSNQTGLIVEGIVKDASLPSDELDHSQVEKVPSKKAVDFSNSDEQVMSISTEDSIKTDSVVEGFVKDTSQPFTSDIFDPIQIKERSPKKTVESGSSNEHVMSISTEDSNQTGLIIEGIKDASLASDELDHCQVEDSSSKKAVESANSNEQLMSISTNDPNKTGSIVQGIVKDASRSLPSDEPGHSQIEDGLSKKVVKSADSDERLISIFPEDSDKTGSIDEGIVISSSELKDVKVSDSVNISVEDLNKTEITSGGLDMPPSHLKDKESSNSNSNIGNGASGVDLDVRNNDHGNIINNIESIDNTRPSLRSDKSWVEEEGTKKDVSSDKSSREINRANQKRGIVDTAAPFESVKDVVCKFGGITDWKAHRSQTKERQRRIQLELEKVLEEIPQYKKQADDAEDEKARVLDELESVKRIIEELKLSLEKAETEEAQAKQDSELAQLRIKEMEQGIANESSVAAKEQLNVAKSRHAAAVAELESVKKELKNIQEGYGSLVNERDIAIKQAEEAISASKDVEKTVEDLTMELITAREALESAHAAHMEAEEHRIGATLARDNDSLNWQKELKQAEGEVQLLNEKLLSVKDLQLKLDASSDLLNDLKSELAAYMEAKLKQESESLLENNFEIETVEAQKSHASRQEEVASTKKELEEVRGNVEKVKEELDILKKSAASLKSEIETENTALATMRQREGMASITVSSLESELNKTKREIELVQTKEKDVREKMVELPKVLQQAAQESDEAKSLAQSVQEEFKFAKEEAEQARGSKRTMISRLNAALKETEASRASERLAKAAIKALQESEQASEMGGLEGGSHAKVTLSLEEYYALSKEAHDAEERAGESVAAAFSQIEAAKESETRSLEELELAKKELAEKKEELELAVEKKEKANEGKLAVEQELRSWRAENERRRKSNSSTASQASVNVPRSPLRNFSEKGETKTGEESPRHNRYSTSSSPGMHTPPENHHPEEKVKKKKSLFPRIVTLLARKKASGSS